MFSTMGSSGTDSQVVDTELFGIYTHVIYPDNLGGKAEKATALGLVTELTESWGTIPLVPHADIGEVE